MRSIPDPVSDDEVCLGSCCFGQKLGNFCGIMLSVSVQEEKKPKAGIIAQTFFLVA